MISSGNNFYYCRFGSRTLKGSMALSSQRSIDFSKPWKTRNRVRVTLTSSPYNSTVSKVALNLRRICTTLSLENTLAVLSHHKSFFEVPTKCLCVVLFLIMLLHRKKTSAESFREILEYWFDINRLLSG